MKTIKEHDIHSNVKNVISRRTLNYTDIVANSNKFYNLEIQEHDNGKFFLYTSYGRVGGAGVNEYRECASQAEADKEAEKIIKSKNKKGYVEVLLTKAEVGSSIGRSKVEASLVSEADLDKAGIKKDMQQSSKLHPEVQSLVKVWFASTNDFVVQNLDQSKCPLGNLSLVQLNKARDILAEARNIIKNHNADIQELNRLTNSYYSNIPHNFGYRKIDADLLRLDTDIKIDKGIEILEIFGDAKSFQNVMNKGSSIDEQYNSLNTEIEFIDDSSAIWKWIDKYFHGTRAHNHSHLGQLKINRIFKFSRRNEESLFDQTLEQIAKECGKQVFAPIAEKFLKARIDVSKEKENTYKSANVSLLAHGTRTENLIGLSKKGFLLNPGGNVVITGKMYGAGSYFSASSSKACNYSSFSKSYWTNGNSNTGYLFLNDVACGNQKIASGSYNYNKNNIHPDHSVWAPAGRGGVINDEMIVFNGAGPGQQHQMRYIVEFGGA